MQKLISIEGVDGCGKSTVVTYLNHYLSKHFKTFIASEPHTDYGKLAKFGDNELTIGDHIFLWWLARRKQQHYFTSQDFDIIIKDRYYDSTFVYAYDTIMKYDLKETNYDERLFIKPNATFILVAEPDILIKRINTRDAKEDQYGSIHVDKIEKRQQRFISLPKQHPNRKTQIIDTTKLRPNEIVNQIVDTMFGEK